MDKNIIFCFTGTGNSLKAAIDIGHTLTNCKIVPMKKANLNLLQEKYASIGFLFPVYFGGTPAILKRFVSKLDFSQNQNAYIYALCTCGGFSANALSEMNALLKPKNVKLHYGQKIIMGSNYIAMYNTSHDLEKTEQSYKNQLLKIKSAIKVHQKNKIKAENKLIAFYHARMLKAAQKKDNFYTVSSDCIGCGICEKICPVNNIGIKNAKPYFKHHCEQCMACIQYCPKKALNYKNKTQQRGRYQNPNLSVNDVADFNHSKDIQKS